MTAPQFHRRRACGALLLVLAAASTGCRTSDAISDIPSSSTGPAPQLPAPKKSWLPTVNIAPAKGWVDGAKPVAADGLAVTAFATGLDHPRWVVALPNGDVLVAESNRPPKGEGAPGGGVRGWVMGKVMARAGGGVPSADRITLLRDADGDGVAETRSVLLANLMSPFGMALVGDQLYVANADAIVRFPYTAGAMKIEAPPARLTDLPGGPLNHHWTKNIIASRDGSKLYATVGSNSNVAENGLPAEEGRAAVWEVDVATGAKRLYATGLRNPNGLAWNPASGALWTVVNERDELGDELVPDYLTSVRPDGFYGWPYSYYGTHVDTRVKPPRPDLVAKAIVPDYALGSHVAPLGLVTTDGAASLPEAFRGGMAIGLHGSWNRKELSGYKVVYVPFDGAKPSGPMRDVLTGFVDDEGRASGRPVGVAIDGRGALLVADDVGNTIWRVAASTR
jgi:glucose/arabinose dehydrogenase